MNARLPEKKIDSIRIDTGAKRIEVNDEGEYITLNFADQSLSTRSVSYTHLTLPTKA